MKTWTLTPLRPPLAVPKRIEMGGVHMGRACRAEPITTVLVGLYE